MNKGNGFAYFCTIFLGIFIAFFNVLWPQNNVHAKEAEPVRIVFLGESSSSDPVWLYRVNRMNQTTKKLPNVKFSFRFAEGDYQKHVKMIEEEVHAGANVIIGPWWDPMIYNDAITNAVKKGVFVYGLLGIGPKQHLPPEIIEKLGWTQTNWTEFGKRLANLMIDHVPHETDIFWPAEIATSPYITDAVTGFKSVYAKKKIPVNVTVVEVGFDTQKATQQIIAYLQRSNVRAIATSGAIAIDAANRAVKEMDKKPNDIALIGQIISPNAVQGIQEGFMPAGINLELTQSSDDAVIDSFDVVSKQAIPSRKSVDFIEVTKENVTKVVPSSLLN